MIEIRVVLPSGNLGSINESSSLMGNFFPTSPLKLVLIQISLKLAQLQALKPAISKDLLMQVC